MLAHKLCTVRRAKRIILYVWIFATCYCSPWLLLTKVERIYYIGIHPPVYTCKFKLNREHYKGYFLTDMVLFYVLPLVMALVLYALIAKILYANKNNKILRHRTNGGRGVGIGIALENNNNNNQTLHKVSSSSRSISGSTTTLNRNQQHHPSYHHHQQLYVSSSSSSTTNININSNNNNNKYNKIIINSNQSKKNTDASRVQVRNLYYIIYTECIYLY